MAGSPRALFSTRSRASTRIFLGRNFTAESADYFLLLGTTMFLVVFGLIMVLSSSSVDSGRSNAGFFGSFWRQGLSALVGVLLMLIVSRLPAKFFRRIAWPGIIVAGAFQLLVFTPLGEAVGGNRNWILIGGVSAQPSEVVKLALVIWLGTILSLKKDLLSDWKHALIPVLPVAGGSILLVLLGDDLGTVMVMAGIVIGALFFAGVRLRVLGLLVLSGAVIAVLAVVTSPNRFRRVVAFLGDECTDYAHSCWQPLHGMWALADGGVFGVGLGNSRAKWSWLPAADNDYIFAIIGEEMGFLGAIVVLALFVLLAVVFVRIMSSSSDMFVRVVTGAVLAWIIGQAFLNVGVVLRLVPVLGVPLPLISAGGSALITSLLAIGIVLSFARERATLPPQFDSDLSVTR